MMILTATHKLAREGAALGLAAGGVIPLKRNRLVSSSAGTQSTAVTAAATSTQPQKWTLCHIDTAPRSLPRFLPREFAQRMHGTPSVKGLLVDAAGTLCSPSESAAAVYLRYGKPFGVTLSEDEILRRFRTAYNSPWTESSIRYVGDGKPFWKHIVTQSTGNDSIEMFEQIYGYYQRPEAWTVTPGAVAALNRLRSHGIKLAVVSNFDTRLRPLLDGLKLTSLFDQIIVSAEEGVEKPCPLLFEEAVSRLGLKANQVVHLGDDRRNDVWGARDAGIPAWLWGSDVTSFEQVADKVLKGDMQI